MPETNSEHGTVGEFYHLHKQGPSADIYFDKLPTKWKASTKGRRMVLEVVIDIDAVSTCFSYV